MKLALTLTIAVLMTACGGTGAPSSSGIRGHAVLGPVCPVEPCDALSRPYHGSFSVLKDGDVAATVKTDALGNFSKPLDSGEYILESVGGLPLLKPVSITVRPGVFTHLQLTFDSGIRAP